MTRLINGFVSRDAPDGSDSVVPSNFSARWWGAPIARMIAARALRAGDIDTVGLRADVSAEGPVPVPARMIELAVRYGVPLELTTWLWDLSGEGEVLAPNGRRPEWLPAQFAAEAGGSETWYDWEPSPGPAVDGPSEEYVRIGAEILDEDHVFELGAAVDQMLHLTAICDCGPIYVVILDLDLLEALCDLRVGLTLDVLPSEGAADDTYARWDRLGLFPRVE